jgi:hypothetical protein
VNGGCYFHLHLHLSTSLAVHPPVLSFDPAQSAIQPDLHLCAAQHVGVFPVLDIITPANAARVSIRYTGPDGYWDLKPDQTPQVFSI